MLWYGEHMSGWGWWTLMTLGMIVFWGALIVGVVLLLRSPRSATGPSASPAVRPSPERILAERFASGEIDENEYSGRLDALPGSGRP
ncbi:MAG: hypothetical protein WKF47_19830 [Geodermatophilaceae bacterium]